MRSCDFVETMGDPLFEVRNAFYLGAYQQCIEKAQNLRLKGEDERLAKDVFMYRYCGEEGFRFGLPSTIEIHRSLFTDLKWGV